MAIKPIEMIAPEPVVIEKKAKKGGGGTGQLLGTLAGAAVLGGLTAATGGAAAPVAMAALQGAGGGAAIGGMLGEKIKPSQEGSTAIGRRQQLMQAPQTQSEPTQKLKESLLALRQAPPEIKQEHGPLLAEGYIKSVLADRGLA